jgi:hypothetical protein
MLSTLVALVLLASNASLAIPQGYDKGYDSEYGHSDFEGDVRQNSSERTTQLFFFK